MAYDVNVILNKYIESCKFFIEKAIYEHVSEKKNQPIY